MLIILFVLNTKYPAIETCIPSKEDDYLTYEVI